MNFPMRRDDFVTRWVSIPVLRERIMVWGCRFFDGIGTNDAESWVAVEMAIRLSPNDPLMWAFLNLQGMIRFNAEGYDAASEIFQRASRLPNGLYWIPIGLAACSWQLGDEQGARDIIDAARTDYPGLSYATVINFAGPGIRSLYSDILLKAGLPEE
jgi:hypothetical protein